ncbi:MAG: HTTM domain-containing protein [Myxococcota bacterium]
MSTWQETWHAPIAGVRPWLFQRVLLLLVAHDAWLRQVGHGGKVGAGGFNVAHFAWLDVVLPRPDAALYVGLMLATGLLAFVGALGGPTRGLFVAVTLGWTWGWAMSLQDAWQHHYLVSLLLALACLGPAPAARAGMVEEGAWAWRLGAVTLAIVYAYAAFAKLDGSWLGGDPLRRATGDALEPLVYGAWVLGVPESDAWAWMAGATLVLEVGLAVAYVLAVRANRPGRVHVLLAVAACAAIAFHVGIELTPLTVGSFTAYMVACACAWLLPRPLLEAVAGLAPRLPPSARLAVPAAVVGGLAVVAASTWLDMPGAEGGLTFASALAMLLVWSRPGPSLALLAAPAALWSAVALTDVRFDFYRYLGGDLARRGEVEAAIEAYEAASRYAPPGRDRSDRVRWLRERAGAAPPFEDTGARAGGDP